MKFDADLKIRIVVILQKGLKALVPYENKTNRATYIGITVDADGDFTCTSYGSSKRATGHSFSYGKFRMVNPSLAD